MSGKTESTLTLKVTLDENKIPEKILWSAPDGQVVDESAQAILLSLWNATSQETSKIDLWVKEMPVDQMQLFFYQTLLLLSETYFKATNDEQMTEALRDYCNYFAEQRNIKES